MMTLMRTIVEIPEDQIRAVDELCRRQRISRAEFVRRSVAATLRAEQPSLDATGAFGLWRKRREDALAYEDRVRSEWER
jgi:metal-responsive CopG/Arc/MetJ family transcriptional regulator